MREVTQESSVFYVLQSQENYNTAGIVNQLYVFDSTIIHYSVRGSSLLNIISVTVHNYILKYDKKGYIILS